MLSNMLTMLGNRAAHAYVNSITCFAVGSRPRQGGTRTCYGESGPGGWLAGCWVGQGFGADDDQVISRLRTPSSHLESRPFPHVSGFLDICLAVCVGGNG